MLKTGTVFTSTVKVDNSNTARTMGSGDMDVFATPALVAVMESAAASLASEGLTRESTTVGSRIDITHLRPTAMGDSVTARAELTAIDGRKLTFRVEASDSKGLIGEGEHIRYVVDRERFMEKLLQDN